VKRPPRVVQPGAQPSPSRGASSTPSKESREAACGRGTCSDSGH
jgi:hypothetical protein